MDNKANIVRLIIFAVILGGIILVMSLMVGATKTSTKYDSFAQCTADKGVKFFGAFWCPHCQEFKKALMGSAKYMNYIECSTPDGQGQTPACQAVNIESYPTFEFPDGSRLTGYNDERDLKALAAKSGCELPTDSAQ